MTKPRPAPEPVPVCPGYWKAWPRGSNLISWPGPGKPKIPCVSLTLGPGATEPPEEERLALRYVYQSAKPPERAPGDDG